MKISFKVFIIPGVNSRTISGEAETDEASTLSWLLDYININYKINLDQIGGCIALMDGKPLDLKRDKAMNIENNNELLVVPMISGG